MDRRPPLLAIPVLAAVCLGLAGCGERQTGPPARTVAWRAAVAPFLAAHCTGCHGGFEPSGGVSFEALAESSEPPDGVALRAGALRFERMADHVDAGIMPPADEPRPPPQARVAFSTWLLDALDEAWREAPVDPGRVTMRRLSRTEYRNSVRDLLVLAFQTDATRVATFMLGNGGSNLSYPGIGVPEGHHGLSHHGGDAAKIARIRAINRFHVEQVAYLLERLAAVQEGEGTLLDKAMVVCGSRVSDGNRHNHDDLPVLLAGRGGGLIRPGRHVQYPRWTPLNDLYLAVLKRLGVVAERFEDGRGPLPGLA